MRSQENIIKSQNQLSIGTIPKYISRESTDNAIQQTRYNVKHDDKKINDDDKYDPYYDYLLQKGIFAENYKTRIPSLNKQVDLLKENFFSCNKLLEKLK